MIPLLLLLALSQVVAAEAPVFDQKSPTIIECIVAVPESVKDPAKATDAKEAYKIVTFQDEKAVLKLAADLKYDVVSCEAPVTTADKTSKVTVTAKEPPCECQDAAVHKCKVNAIDPKDGKPVKVAAASNLTYQSGELIECAVPPVKKVCVQLYGKESMPDACWPAKAKPDVKAVDKVAK